jgi:hypothetical protein
MQIIDELEVHQRGPYGGGVGMVSFLGNMDMALALRTMVIPTNREDTIYSYRCAASQPASRGRCWRPMGSGGVAGRPVRGAQLRPRWGPGPLG